MLYCTTNSESLRDAKCSIKLLNSHSSWECNSQINVPHCTWHSNLYSHQLDCKREALIQQKFAFVADLTSRKLALLGEHRYAVLYPLTSFFFYFFFPSLISLLFLISLLKYTIQGYVMLYYLSSSPSIQLTRI